MRLHERGGGITGSPFPGNLGALGSRRSCSMHLRLKAQKFATSVTAQRGTNARLIGWALAVSLDFAAEGNEALAQRAHKSAYRRQTTRISPATSSSSSHLGCTWSDMVKDGLMHRTRDPSWIDHISSRPNRMSLHDCRRAQPFRLAKGIELCNRYRLGVGECEALFRAGEMIDSRLEPGLKGIWGVDICYAKVRFGALL